MLESQDISCPYCGEMIEILLEPDDGLQQYYEDCSVCCRPILISLRCMPDLTIELTARRDDD